MINTGSKQNFTQEEIQMFKDIERMTNGSARLKMEGQPKCHNMFLLYYWKNREVPFNEGETTMHYGQTTDESVCCQIFPGMLQDENNVKFDVTNVSFWLQEPNPWQIIFDGYKKGIKPGKQVITLYFIGNQTTLTYSFPCLYQIYVTVEQNLWVFSRTHYTVQLLRFWQIFKTFF